MSRKENGGDGSCSPTEMRDGKGEGEMDGCKQ